MAIGAGWRPTARIVAVGTETGADVPLLEEVGRLGEAEAKGPAGEPAWAHSQGLGSGEDGGGRRVVRVREHDG